MAPTRRPEPTAETTTAPTRPHRLRRSRRVWGLVSVITLLAGLTFTGVALAAERRNVDDRADAATRTLVDDVTTAFNIELQRQSDFVVATAGAVSTNPDMTTAELERWMASTRIVERHPEVTGMGFVRYVPRDDLERHAARLAADPAVADVLDPAGRLEVEPPSDRAHYCLLQAVGFQSTDEAIVEPDVDICSDPSLASTIGPMITNGQSVYRSGTTIAGDVPLIVVTPVFDAAGVPTTITGRREAFVGAVATLLDAEEVIAHVLGPRDDVAVQLRHLNAHSEVVFENRDLDAAAGPQHVVPLLPGWQLVVRPVEDPTPGWTGMAAGLLVAGVAAPVLLAILLFVLGTTRARALDLVDEATEELRHRALHDPLTGLANRRLITERADALIARARRDGSVPAALFLDLDGFKAVNDTHGHAAGDQVLQVLADRLREVVRTSDTVGRLGGDEFVVLLDGADADEHPESVAARVVEVVRAPIPLEGRSVDVAVTASVGVAVGPRADGDQLLHDADVAAYAAKGEGKDGWVVAGADADVPATS